MGTVTVSTKGGEFALLIPQHSFNELGLEPGAEYELVKAKPGIWVLVAKEKPEKEENPLDGKILAIIEKKDLKERVEGKFEKFLSKEELARFKEMVREGSIVPFKLSPKYKKAVYKTRNEVEKNIKMGKRPEAKETGFGKKESESSNAAEKRPDHYSLEKDGFLVFKNSENAKILSVKFKKEIGEGNIKGIKSFDGFFYVIQSKLYQRHRAKVLEAIKQEKGIGSASISKKLDISKQLAKIVCELLKDEGEIIEKRKDQFQAI